ncbi:hypothetical protein ACFLS9_08075 [Bacteroidota bacterium]
MINQILNKILFLVILILVYHNSYCSSGKVYLVLGSDTAIWEGMNTNTYHCYYNIDLFTNPMRNTYQVMDPLFRAKFKDSFGQPLKLTWWMMAGNIFRYANNTNVPIANIMTMYLMKKYHGENVNINGDELTLHYHTFFWSDYDGDGTYWWNQSHEFMDCFDDFNYTLAQFMLEEKIFPVSFRSGWHYMDNGWQNYLDNKVLPYSLHNDYPAKHFDETEPTNNNIDWSLAPSEFVPYHPSTENYQIPGDGPGWNVRSAHFGRTILRDYLDSLFSTAQSGEDQVACIWGHLPETDFLSNIEIIDSLAHRAAAKYPEVKFQYCTAIEAMKLWRKTSDNQPPNVMFNEELSGDYVKFKVTTDEPIFQSEPFIAVKDIYERYFVVPCTDLGSNSWESSQLFLRKDLVKAGVAVCDTLGNQTLKFIEYLPDDVFIDNLDEGYNEIAGNWSTIPENAWGIDSRIANLSENDSAIVTWIHNISKTSAYNIFIQVPSVSNPADTVIFKIYQNQERIKDILILNSLPPNEWNHLSTIIANEYDEIIIEMTAHSNENTAKTLTADVVKISPLVKDRDIHLSSNLIDFGIFSVEDTASFTLKIHNLGIKELQIQQIFSSSEFIFSEVSLPSVIRPMGNIEVPLYLYSLEMGIVNDTLWITSNDPIDPNISVPFYADITGYFEITDNEDSLYYEEYGIWNYSVAQAYGSTSRYAYLNSATEPFARFSAVLKKSGVYEIFEIVPKTENASNNALYEFRIDNVIVDSTYIDQNLNSGDWVSLGRQFVPANVEVEVRVIHNSLNTSGVVLRADAIQFIIIKEITDIDDNFNHHLLTSFYLNQNYPNPFNPTTVISYIIPNYVKPAQKSFNQGSLVPYNNVHVELKVFDILGKEVVTLVNKEQSPGNYKVEWNAANYSSGVYFYKLEVTGASRPEPFIDIKKMILLK